MHFRKSDVLSDNEDAGLSYFQTTGSIFQTIHRVLIFRAKQSLRMRFRIGSGTDELSSLSTQLDRIMINMTVSDLEGGPWRTH